MTVPAPRTWADLDRINATRMNLELRDYMNWMILNRPFCYVYQGTATTSLTTATLTSLLFDTEASDVLGMHSTATNTDRIVLPELGWYWVEGALAVATSATGDRIAELRLNGSGLKRMVSLSNGSATAFRTTLGMMVQCTAAGVDYVSLAGYQNSGGTLTTALGQYQTSLSALWVHS